MKRNKKRKRLFLLIAYSLILLVSAGPGHAVDGPSAGSTIETAATEAVPPSDTAAAPSKADPAPKTDAGTWNIHPADGFLPGLAPFCCGVFTGGPQPALLAGTPVTGVLRIDPGAGAVQPITGTEDDPDPMPRRLFRHGASIAVCAADVEFIGLIDPAAAAWRPRSEWIQLGAAAAASDESEEIIWTALPGKVVRIESGQTAGEWGYPQGLPPLEPRIVVAGVSSVWLLLSSVAEPPQWWLVKAGPAGFEGVHPLGPVAGASPLVRGALSDRYLWLAFGTPREPAGKLYAWEIATSVLLPVDYSSCGTDGAAAAGLPVTALETREENLWIGIAGRGAFLCRPVSPDGKPGTLALEVEAAPPSELADKIIYDFVPSPEGMWLLSTGLLAEYNY